MTDICVFAGRFRPFHAGHLAVVRAALDKAQYAAIIVGSCDEPINFRNPFTFAEVREMIRRSLTSEEADRVFILPVTDHDTDRAWVAEVQSQIKALAARLSFEGPKVSLIGFAKDGSSYYLKLFPQWGSYDAPHHEALNATDFRRDIYQSPDPQSDLASWRAQGKIPNGTFWFLREWVATESFDQMKKEYLFMADYLGQFTQKPYPRYFTAADACCLHSGHVLLIRRATVPGEGLWALPGGHVGIDETFKQAAMRELTEETGIDIDPLTLAMSSIGEKVLDNPWRSTRVRTISIAYGFDIIGTSLPAVTAADDAQAARWWPLDEITRGMMFEDHYSVIRHFANLSNQ